MDRNEEAGDHDNLEKKESREEGILLDSGHDQEGGQEDRELKQKPDAVRALERRHGKIIPRMD